MYLAAFHRINGSLFSYNLLSCIDFLCSLLLLLVLLPLVICINFQRIPPSPCFCNYCITFHIPPSFAIYGNLPDYIHMRLSHAYISCILCSHIYLCNLIMSATVPAPFPSHLKRSQDERFFSPPWSRSLEEDVLRQIWNQILYGDWIVGNSRSSHRCLKIIRSDLRSRRIDHLPSRDDFAAKLQHWS